MNHKPDYCLLSSVVTDTGSQPTQLSGVSSLTFDLGEELLWIGNSSGHVTSFYNNNNYLDKYTSFHVDYLNDIRDVLTCSNGILSLTRSSLRLSIRRGLTVFNHKSELLRDMQCMTLLPSGLLLMGGHQDKMIEMDIERVKHVRVTDTSDNGCVVMRQNARFLCHGDTRGKITLRDHNQLQVQREFQSHSSLSDFDANGNYLVTCGFSERHGSYITDQFLTVYDFRMLKAISPIPLPNFSPYLLRFIPLYASKFCVVSQTGQFQLIDVTESLSVPRLTFNVELMDPNALITSFDVSTSSQALSFGDDHNCVYLFGASDQVTFNKSSGETEFPDPIEPFRQLPITDKYTPVSEIFQINYYGLTEKLLSDMPPEMCKKTYRPLPVIDPKILSSMKMVGTIGYAPNIGMNRLNLGSTFGSNHSGDANHASKRNSPETPDVLPHRYQLLEPNYNKMDKDEYDFGRYNHSSFTGLDSTLPNSYSNNIIQTLYFIAPLRSTIIGHLCKKEFCLACELSFLFHMLNIAPRQTPCQASNFLRAFRTIPEAIQLKLIFPEDPTMKKQINYTQKAQQWLRFILNQLHNETSKAKTELHDNVSEEENESVFKDGEEKDKTKKNDKKENTKSKNDSRSVVSVINDLFSFSIVRYFTCNKCEYKWQETHNSFPITLTYPSSDNLHCTSFIDLLRNSILPEQITAYCEKCAKYQPVIQNRGAKCIPDILAINTGLDNENAIKFWKKQISLLPNNQNAELTEDGPKSTTGALPDMPQQIKPCRYGNNCTRSNCKFFHEKDKPNGKEEFEYSSWIPFAFNAKIDADGKLSFCNSGSNSDDEYVKYQLINVTSVIKKKEFLGNIVSAIKIDPIYLKERKQTEQTNEWFLFNHFSINPISREEVVHLDLDWKLPSIIIYGRIDLNTKHQNLLKAKNPITQEVFGEDLSIAARARRGSISFTPLKDGEMPKKGDLIAMDAEFVTLNQQETEIRGDGTHNTIKPSQKSVARISCVRGDGSNEGEPFIDDYIATQDQVVDYMTKFSGIQPGDLDVAVSSKHLTTLKSTYLKLRFLIDTGCIFVGHGLKNDFRVINLIVPTDQVVDTVYIFQSPSIKRMVSLKFLAWHFLGGLIIQTVTHDSVEDAKTALRLYKKYLELKRLNCIEEAIEDLFKTGRELAWQVPGGDANE